MNKKLKKNKDPFLKFCKKVVLEIQEPYTNLIDELNKKLERYKIRVVEVDITSFIGTLEPITYPTNRLNYYMYKVIDFIKEEENKREKKVTLKLDYIDSKFINCHAVKNLTLLYKGFRRVTKKDTEYADPFYDECELLTKTIYYKKNKKNYFYNYFELYDICKQKEINFSFSSLTPLLEGLVPNLKFGEWDNHFIRPSVFFGLKNEEVINLYRDKFKIIHFRREKKEAFLRICTTSSSIIINGLKEDIIPVKVLVKENLL